MTVATESAARRGFEPAKSRPAPELVVSGFFGPLADRLALALVPLRVPPTALVLANGAAGLAAAALLGGEAVVAAALLLQLKTLFDNADGRLARASGRVTLVGRYLDTEVDLAVNVVLFAALAALTREPWLGLAAFLALTLLLSAGFNLAELYRQAHGRPTSPPPSSGGVVERALEGFYGVVFGSQDCVLRALATRRLARIVDGEESSDRVQAATLAYHDRSTMAVLANLGLSTQLAVLGACLVLGAPVAYLWLVVGSVALLPLLQLRRERLARRALSVRREA
jgi:archaetidylinositol phosphate synthase